MTYRDDDIRIRDAEIERLQKEIIKLKKTKELKTSLIDKIRLWFAGKPAPKENKYLEEKKTISFIEEREILKQLKEQLAELERKVEGLQTVSWEIVSKHGK